MADINTSNPLESLQELKTRLETITAKVEEEKATLDRLKSELDEHKAKAEELLAEGIAAVDATQANINANNLSAAQTSNTTAIAKKTELETLLATIDTKTAALEASANKLATYKEQAESLKADVDFMKLHTKDLEPDIFNDSSTKGFWQFNNTTTPGMSGINGSYDAMSRFYSGFSDNNRELNIGMSMEIPYYGMKINLPATPFAHVPTLTADNIALYKGLSQCDNTTSEQEWNPNRRIFSAARKPAIEDNESWTLSFNYDTRSNANGGMDFMSIKNHFYTGKVHYVTNSGTSKKALTDFSLHEQMFFTNRAINTGSDANGLRSPFKDTKTLPTLRIRLDASFFNTYNGAAINAPYAGTNYKELNLDKTSEVFGNINPTEAFTLNPVIDYVQTAEGNPMGAVALTTPNDYAIKRLRGQTVDDPGAHYTYVNAYIKKDDTIEDMINYTWTFNTKNGHISAFVNGVKKLEFHIEVVKGSTKSTYLPFFYNSYFASRADDFIPQVTTWPDDASSNRTLTPARIIDEYVNNLPKEEDNDWYQDKIIFFRFPYSADINIYDRPILKDVRILNKIVSEKEIKSLASESLETNYDINIDREKRIIYNIKPNIFRDGSDIAYAKNGQTPIIAKNWFAVNPEEESVTVTSGYENKEAVDTSVKATAAKSDFTHAKYPETTDFTVSFVVDKDFSPESATALLVGMLGYSTSDSDRIRQFETWQDGKDYPVYSVPKSAKAETYFELRYNNAVVGGMRYNETDVHFNNCIAFPSGKFKEVTNGYGGRILCSLSMAPGVDSVNITNRILKVFTPDVISSLFKPASFDFSNSVVFKLDEDTDLSLQLMSRSITGGGSTYIKPVALTTVFRHESGIYNTIQQLLDDPFEELSKPNNGVQFDNTTQSVKTMSLAVNNKKSQLFAYEVANSGKTPSEKDNIDGLHLTTAQFTNSIMNPSNTLFVPVYDNDPSKVRVTIIASTSGDTQTIKSYIGTELRDSVIIGSANSDNTDDYNGTINNKIALRLLPHKFNNEIFGAKEPYSSNENHACPYGIQAASQFFYNENLENNQEDPGLAVNKIYEVSIFNRALSIDDVDVLVKSDSKEPGELIYDVELPAEAPIITSADVDIDGNPSYRGVEESDVKPDPKPSGNAGGSSSTDDLPYDPNEGQQPKPQEPEVPATGDFAIKYDEGIPYAVGAPVDVTSLTAGKKMKLTNVDLYFSVYSSSTKRYSMIHEHIDSVEVDLAQITKSGVYYVKRAQSSSNWEIVSGRPIVGNTSTTGDYYMGGDWYNKNGTKLEPLTYLPFHLVVDAKNLKTVAYNLYSGLSDDSVSIATLPEGEWYTMDNQRQWGVIYTNTTKYTMMVVVAGDRNEELTTVVTRSNSIEAYTLKNAETLMFLVEPNERYKVTNSNGVTKKWQEFKRVN